MLPIFSPLGPPLSPISSKCVFCHLAKFGYLFSLFFLTLQVGVHVFLVLFESQPQMKRIFRSYRGKKHSELRLNEDLQQLVMYLISVLKKIVKYLEESRTIVKYLRRIAKKYSSPSIDLARFDPHDLAALFCNAVRETLPRNNQVILLIDFKDT